VNFIIEQDDHDIRRALIGGEEGQGGEEESKQQAHADIVAKAG
jgi:hypothetical protein